MKNVYCEFCKAKTDYISCQLDKAYFVCPRCGKVHELEVDYKISSTWPERPNWQIKPSI